MAKRILVPNPSQTAVLTRFAFTLEIRTVLVRARPVGQTRLSLAVLTRPGRVYTEMVAVLDSSGPVQIASVNALLEAEAGGNRRRVLTLHFSLSD